MARISDLSSGYCSESEAARLMNDATTRRVAAAAAAAAECNVSLAVTLAAQERSCVVLGPSFDA